MVIFKAIILFVILIVMPMFIGYLPLHFLRKYHIKPSIILSIVFGYILEFASFEIYSVPCVFLDTSLTILTCIYVFTNIVLISLTIFFNKEYFTQRIHEIRSFKFSFAKFFKENYIPIIVLILVLFQSVYLSTHMHEDADDAYYVAQGETSVYTDSLYRYSALTGKYNEDREVQYMLGPFPLFYAVLSSLSHVESTIIAHSVVPLVFIPICYMAYFVLAKKLFDDDMEKTWIFLFFLCILSIFGNYTIRNNSTFMLFRIWQGKAMLANFIIPALWYFWFLAEECDFKGINYLLILLCLFAGLFTTTMSTIICTIILGSLAFIDLLRKRNIKRFIKICLCIVPLILCSAAYILF